MKRPALVPFRPALGALLSPVAPPILSSQVGRGEGRRIIARAQELCPAHVAAVDDTAELGVGRALVMRLSATVIALHEALIEAGATLVRTGSIAAGAPICDFRWRANPIGQGPSLRPDVPASVTL